MQGPPVTDTPNPKPGFWTTLPGFLTAIAALVTAGAGLYAVVHKSEPAVSSSLRASSSSTPGSSSSQSAHDSASVTPRPSSTTDTASSEQQSTGSATTTKATSTPLVPYVAADYSAEIPAGWHQVEDEVLRPSETESRWHAPGSENDYLLIDSHPPTHLIPEEDAAPVHADLEKAPSYREIYYGPGDLTGITSWMWVFNVEGSERIDYFFETCRKTMAVLGSTEQGHFDQSRPIFRAVAQSVRAHCG
jgi:hypothetical protein